MSTEQNMSCAQVGEPQQWMNYLFAHPLLPKPAKGKHFLKEELGLSGMEISINSLPGKVAMPFSHTHRLNEEVYFFLSGEGEFCVDDHIVSVSAGSVVRVAPEGRRCWRNIGEQPLNYLVIQARNGSMPGGTIEDGMPIPGNPWRLASM